MAICKNESPFNDLPNEGKRDPQLKHTLCSNLIELCENVLNKVSVRG